MCGNEIAINDTLFVHPLGAGLLDLEPDVAVAGEPAAFGDAGGDQNLDTVTNGENPFALLVERSNEPQQIGVVPEKLRRPPSDQKHGVVVGGFRLPKCNVCLDKVAGALDVGVPPGFEVVDDAM